MKSEIFGHDDNVEKIYDRLACAKAGLNDASRPLSNFLFVGGTGVGKTYTAKKIAKYYFGNPESFIQLNMSEYQDKTGVAKLIGANAGYVGYDEGGLLTEYVRNHPNCVVLFDEVEKCEAKILDLLLQILDEGYITDNLNRKIDFKNSVIIMTSNIGQSEKSKRSMGFLPDSEESASLYHRSLKKHLRPELISRIDETIIFEDLAEQDLIKIIHLELIKIKNRLTDKNIELEYSPALKRNIFKQLESQKPHAREIKNLVKTLVQVPLSHFIVKNRNVEKISIKVINKNITCA
jgi:ATP-dependent Clp protease ATP-binding subunit ClpA